MIGRKVVILCVFSVALALPPKGNLSRYHSSDDPENPEETAGYFEGDMILSRRQKLELFTSSKNGKVSEEYRWPDSTVVYKITGDFTDEQKEAIQNTMNNIQGKSCVKFVEKTDDGKHYVAITNKNKGCFADVGYRAKTQKLNLGDICFKKAATPAHEMLHTLGFHHMQSAHDRDNFVKILFDNIKDEYKLNFKKYSSDTVTHFGEQYDYGSVMHYRRKAFSKNGEDTIVPVDSSAEIGQRDDLSEVDVKKLNAMYKC